jgi:arylsulfatase A-like enzyme
VTAPSSASDPVNFVLVILDCVRPDHIGCYGYERGTTPNLDAFAATATRFDNAITAGVWTLPSMASMMTGCYPSQHGLNRADRALGRDLVTLPQRLAAAGWRTAGFTANPHGGRTFELDRGFQEFHEFWGVPGTDHDGPLGRCYRWVRPRLRDAVKRSQALTGAARRLQRRRAEATGGSGNRLADAATAWIRQARDAGQPFFALVHLMESHVPYTPAAEHVERFLDEAGRRRVAELDHDGMAYLASANPLSEDDLALIGSLYDATISHGDELAGRVLDAVGDDPATLVAITADHGQQLGEHRMMGHFFSVYDTLARVPLVLRDPELPAGVVQRPVQTVDLYPTVLEAAGLDPGPGEEWAVSLRAPSDHRPVLVTEYLEPDLTRFARFRGFDPAPFDRELRALRRDGWKYIWSSDGQEELYDLGGDPGETRDLASAARGAEWLRAFRLLHEGWQAEMKRHAAGERAEVALEEDVAASLRALGYFD